MKFARSQLIARISTASWSAAVYAQGAAAPAREQSAGPATAGREGAACAVLPHQIGQVVITPERRAGQAPILT